MRTSVLFSVSVAVAAAGAFLGCSEHGTGPAEDAGFFLDGHRAHVNSVDFSPDGSHLVSGGADSTVRIWDTGSHELVRTIDCPSQVSFVRFDSAGASVLGIHSGEVAWWDAATGDRIPVKAIVTGLRPPYAFSAGTMTLASGGGIDGQPDVPGNRILVHDALTGELLGQFTAGDDELFWAIALSTGGDLLAGGYWRVSTPVTVEGQASIVVWDVESGEIRRAFPAGGGQIESLAWSPAGDRIVSAPSDMREQSVTLWEVETGSLAFALAEEVGSTNLNVAYSRNDSLVAAGAGCRWVRVWSARTGELRSTFPIPAGISELAFSPDGRLLAGAGTFCFGASGHYDRSVHLWELEP